MLALPYYAFDKHTLYQSMTVDATTRDCLVSTTNPFSVTAIRPLLTNTLFSKSFNAGSATRKVCEPASRSSAYSASTSIEVAKDSLAFPNGTVAISGSILNILETSGGILITPVYRKSIAWPCSVLVPEKQQSIGGSCYREGLSLSRGFRGCANLAIPLRSIRA